MATDQHHLLQQLAQEIHRSMGLSPTNSVDLAAAMLPIVEEAVRRRTALPDHTVITRSREATEEAP